MILELKFKPFNLDNRVIVEYPQTVRVSVLASQVSSAASDIFWYLSALPDVVFSDVSTKFDLASDHPCVIYLPDSKTFMLYFVATFPWGEEINIELPLESVTEATDFHEVPW